MLTHCSLGSKWVPNGITGKIELVREGIGHPTSLPHYAGDPESVF